MDLKEIQEIISEQSAKCSEIGRKIAFGLTAVTWAFFFSGEKFSSNFLLITALILEILYFFVDFTQYYFMLIKYRKLYINSRIVYKKRDESIKDEDLDNAVLATQSEINRNGFRFFFVKFPLILLSFVSLLLYILVEITK
ncbi:MAG: hypothetical protein RDU14_00830 [Melioribacteraceae bacterium]|nr:hypothetical protein [Melioribacteraceae bacterium]